MPLFPTHPFTAYTILYNVLNTIERGGIIFQNYTLFALKRAKFKSIVEPNSPLKISL